MKAVLMSIHNKWCELIFSGEKEIEVRKIAPNLETPYKVYVYEPLGKQTSCRKCAIWRDCDLRSPFGCWEGAGAVVGEFVCDRVEKYEHFIPYDIDDELRYSISQDSLISTCLEPYELTEYGNGKPLRGLHITEPKRYDTPKELSEFTPWCEKPLLSYNALEVCCDCPKAVFDEDGAWYGCRVTRAPQSWMYCDERKSAT